MKTPPCTPTAQAAFISWLNLFPLDGKITRIDELSDGLALARVLEDMDSSFKADELNHHASAWLEKRTNLETVFRSLDKYACQDPDLGLDWLPRSYNPKAIAYSPDTDSLCEALAVFVCVALAGPKRTKHIQDIQSKLEPTHQVELAKIFQYKQERSTSEAQKTKPRDRELELEEDKARLHAELENAKKIAADQLTRLERLQFSFEDLKEDNDKLRNELDAARKLQSGNSEATIARLQERLRESEEIISRQEEQIEAENLNAISLNSEVSHLKKLTEKMTALQDKVSELKHANDELSKKANAAERYKQKLETLSGRETEFKNLQYELEESKRTQEDTSKLRAQVSEKLTVIEHLRRIQEDTELHLNDLRTQKDHLSGLLIAKTQELERMHAQRSLDERMIDELREQITSNGLVRRSPSPEPTSPRTQRDGDDPTIGLKLELSKLKAENALLRNGVGVTASNEQLRAELDLSKRNVESLTEKLHKLRVEHVAVQKAVESFTNHLTDEGSEAFKDLYSESLRLREELEQEKAKSRRIDAELKDSNRELLSLRTDYNVATKDSIDALQELKSTHELITASLQNDLKSLQRDYEVLQLDNKEMGQQLVASIRQCDRFRNELDEARAKESRAVDTALEGADNEAKKTLEKTKIKAAFTTMKDQLQKAEQERYDLQRRLRTMEQGGAYAALKAATDQTIKNLQRENAMISSAWYDLTSRLQSNHVVLQRRQDMPKTWLNKQRHLVNATPRR